MGLERLAAAPAGRLLVRSATDAAREVGAIRRAGKTAIGALVGGINEIAGRVHPSFANGCEIVTVRDPDAIRGALYVRRRWGTAPAEDAINLANELRTQRPLLHAGIVDVPADAKRAVTLHVEARAPGNDFQVVGRESTPVAVYVNGSHHSDLIVMAERDTPYNINLAELAPGQHQIELREARDLVAGGGSPVELGTVRQQTLDGVDALMARHAPVIETRWSPRFAAGGAAEQMHSDVPLVTVGLIEPAEGGTQRLRYYLLSSNEDTSGFPFQSIMRKFGRTTDFELAYEAWIDDAGTLVAESFQSPLHVRRSFGGVRYGERPVLRVATRNGLFSSQSYGLTPRWSEAPRRNFTSLPTDREVMLDSPWTFAAMGKENIREGRAAVRGTLPTSNKIAFDAREHLYFDALGPARQAMEGAGEITAVLDDGVRRTFSAGRQDWRPPPPNIGPRTTAVPLPPEVPSGRIEALDLPEGRVFTLDDQFRPRIIPTGAAATRRG